MIFMKNSPFISTIFLLFFCFSCNQIRVKNNENSEIMVNQTRSINESSEEVEYQVINKTITKTKIFSKIQKDIPADSIVNGLFGVSCDSNVVFINSIFEEYKGKTIAKIKTTKFDFIESCIYSIDISDKSLIADLSKSNSFYSVVSFSRVLIEKGKYSYCIELSTLGLPPYMSYKIGGRLEGWTIEEEEVWKIY